MVAYVGDTLHGGYTYGDPEGDPEGVSLYQWYRNDVAIDGATAQDHDVVMADVGTTLTFKVTPVAQTGTLVGNATVSDGVEIGPTSLAGWYSFRDPSTLFVDAGTTPVSSDGDLIYQVNDKSGHNRHLTQATDTARPEYKVGIQAGNSVARFDGARWLLSGATFTSEASAVQTIMVVVKESAGSTLYGVAARTGTTNYRLAMHMNNGSAGLIDAGLGTGSGMYVERWGSVPQGWHVVTMMVDCVSGHSAIYGDGTLRASDSGTPNVQTSNYLALGTRALALLNGLVSDLGEALVFDGYLTDIERHPLEQYLGAAWDIAVA